MRTVSYRLSDLGRAIIPIGKVAENEATQVRIDSSEVFADYPTAVPSLSVLNPSGESYPVSVSTDGVFVLWNVKDSDLTAEGDGEFQLSFSVNTTVVKSSIGHTHVCRSIVADGEAPDPVQDWMTEADSALYTIEHISASATSLPAGSEPTATYSDGALAFGIPQGERGQDGQDGAPGQDGQDGADGVSPSVDVEAITGGHRVTITDAEGDHTFDVMDGAAGAVIDDTAGEGDTDKTWSADKLTSDVLSAISSLDSEKLDAPSTAGTSGQVLVSDGNGGQVWGTAGTGSITVDGTLSVSGAAADAAATGEVKHLADSTSKIYVGKNIANPAKFYSNGYPYSNGSMASASNYYTTDYIPVENGKTYAIGAYSRSQNIIVTDRYGYLMYTSGKQPISDLYVNNSSTAGLTVTISSENVAYMRAFAKLSDGRKMMVCESAYVPYNGETYQETAKVIALLDSTPVAQVEALIPDAVDDALEQFDVPIVQTKQLFDRSKVTVGYCSDSGYIDSSSNYVYTEKIPVTAGKTIYFSTNGTADVARFVTAYNASDEVVSASGAGSETSTYTVPEGIVAVRFSYSNPERGTSYAKYAHFQAEYDEITGYALYGKFFNIDDFLGTDNVLYKKKWAVCGDSFTDGAMETTIQTGKYAGHRVVYPYLIGNRNNMEIVKFFNGGQTLAFPASPGDFTNSLTNPSGTYYYQNIPSDVDYITIYLGINDANHAPGGSATGEIPIGDITDSTTATYCGAWNVVLTWLITNRPHAHIGIIVTNGNSSDTYRQAQIAIAKKYGLAYIDMNGDERTPAMLRTSNPDISSAVKTVLLQKWRVSESNTHPNDDAHVFESTFIENFLRCI